MGFEGTVDLALITDRSRISWVTLGKLLIQQAFIEGFNLEDYRDERHRFCPQGAHRTLSRK